MNMPIHRPEATQVRIHLRDLGEFEPPIILHESKGILSKAFLKYALIGTVAIGAAFAITRMSATTLWVLGASTAAIVALLTAVCIYALNHEAL